MYLIAFTIIKRKSFLKQDLDLNSTSSIFKHKSKIGKIFIKK